MAGIRINLDDAAYQGMVSRLQGLGADFNPILRVFALALIKANTEKFRRQGPGWAPLSKKTLAQRRRLRREGPILQPVGKLRSSVIDDGDGAQGSAFHQDSHSLIVGSNLNYAATHQYGRGNIPARPYLAQPEEVLPDVLREIQGVVADILEGKL